MFSFTDKRGLGNNSVTIAESHCTTESVLTGCRVTINKK